MNPIPSSPAVHVLEVAGLHVDVSTETLRRALMDVELPIRVIGELQGHPAIIIEASCDARQVGASLPPALSLSVEVVELRRHFPPEPLTAPSLAMLISEARKTRRLVVGATAVERAMQRGRLEVLVIAADATAPYRHLLRAVIANHDYGGAITLCELTKTELGHAAAVHRAGCVGLLRGGRHVSI